ncbi:pentapeptide repeat-containing protein [Solirubrobacter taibaiensis]|nr:pentapeptide repeat-containing protein [Solirubrobacter taibaiensis]
MAGRAYFAFERHPGIDLRGVDLVEATLQEAELPGANLDGVAAYDALANGIVLTGASLSGANFAKAALVEADFRDATAIGTRFNRATMLGARFDGADLRGATFRGTHLRGASFIGADVTGADFDGAHLGGAVLSATAPDLEDLDCALYVDGAGDRDTLANDFAGSFHLTADRRWLEGEGVTLLVDDNDDAYGGDRDDPVRGFLFYPLCVEWYFAPDVALPLRVALVSSVMQLVWSAGGRAVAACDYEDALPARPPAS